MSSRDQTVWERLCSKYLITEFGLTVKFDAVLDADGPVVLGDRKFRVSDMLRDAGKDYYDMLKEWRNENYLRAAGNWWVHKADAAKLVKLMEEDST
jgi:hypothetical protein